MVLTRALANALSRFFVAGIKDVHGAPVGDTITLAKGGTDRALPGFAHMQPRVFAGLFPTEADAYPDLRDALETEETLGKPAGQDERLGRPSAVTELGIDGATRQLRERIDMAVDSIPSCPGEVALRHLIRAEATRFMMKFSF